MVYSTRKLTALQAKTAASLLLIDSCDNIIVTTTINPLDHRNDVIFVHSIEDACRYLPYMQVAFFSDDGSIRIAELGVTIS
jgi:hypothetical protein